MTVLVTGASGFIGLALCDRLGQSTLFVRGALRSAHSHVNCQEAVVVGDISAGTDWSSALHAIDHVVHLAARVHVEKEKNADPLSEFRRINVEGTANLAMQAAAAGVKRFIFLSSIKVNGESTRLGQPYTATDEPAPEDPYGVSKHEAEIVLRKISSQTGMEVVIIRPPLVYGPRVKANFRTLMHLVAHGVPLPFMAITNNQRSLVAIDNLVDLIVTCLNHPAAADQVFLVSDGEDLSTAELIKRIGRALRVPARLFYFPPLLLKLGARLTKKNDVCLKICGSLQIDINKTKLLLNWIPPVSVDSALCRTADYFRD